nr:MAG TPA: transmembrane protein [Caudoviricetes sp.]
MSKKSGGLGFGGALTLVFIVLKLCGVINWSWWWVLLPMWGPVALVVGILGVGALCMALAGIKK